MPRPRPPLRALAAVLALASCDARAPSEARPDVVLVVVDTLRADRMGCYGYERATTPFVDGLAEEGALFTDVTAQFSWTVPSMVSMFTGAYLTEVTEAVDADAVTLAQRLRAAGYRTVGASANLLLQEDTGLLAGFERFSAAPEDGKRERGLDELADAAFGDLMDLERDGIRAPVFLYLHAFEPHDPYVRHEAHEDELPPDVPLPKDLRRRMHESFAPHLELAPEDDPEWKKELAWIARARARYDQEVRAVDAAIERLFARLEARGRLDRTLFVLASDHGEGLWEHEPPAWIVEQAVATPRKHAFLPRELFYQKHGAIQFQEVLATPLVLWGAGVPAVRVDAAVENLDVVPTLLELLELLDLPATDELDGESLVPLLDGGDVSRDFVFAGGVQGQSVRELATGLKLVVPIGRALANGAAPRLYDLAADPAELTDLAPGRPADVARLLAAHGAWKQAHPPGETVRGAANERTAALRRRLSAIGYADEESTGD